MDKTIDTHGSSDDGDLTKRLDRLRALGATEASEILRKAGISTAPFGSAEAGSLTEQIDAEIAKARAAVEGESRAAAGSSSQSERHLTDPTGRTALLDPLTGGAPGRLIPLAGWIGLAAALFLAAMVLRTNEIAEEPGAASEASPPIYMGTDSGAPNQAKKPVGSPDPAEGIPNVAKFTGTVDFSEHVSALPPFKVIIIDVTRDVKIDDAGRVLYEVFDPQWSHDPEHDPALPSVFRLEVHSIDAHRRAQALWQQLYSLE